MKVIALTGGIGSGKSTVAAEFEKLGAEVVDSDKISYEIMLPGGCAYNEVVETFGREILFEDRTINRKYLADIVFSDDEKLKTLTGITHRLIYEEIQRRIDMSTKKVVCLEIPLLFTSDCPVDIDLKIAVVAPYEVRISRVIQRDGCTGEQAKMRMAKQLCDDEMIRLSDCYIENSDDIEHLREQVKSIYNKII